MPELDAIILADSPLATVRIAGLDIRERAIRVARRVGAGRVYVIERSEDRAALTAWRNHRACPVLVIRADQLVHTPLVQPLIDRLSRAVLGSAAQPDDAGTMEFPPQSLVGSADAPCGTGPTDELANDGIAMAVAPESALVEDVPPGGYAGAFVASGARSNAVVEALAAGARDFELVERATPVPHGRVARAPIATPEQRRTAHRVLYSILVKPQDNAVTRYLFRPVSFPLTRLLVRTPVTPNQVSYAVAALVLLGCWLTAHEGFGDVLAGTVVVLVASYVDCCDGEIARLKLLSSRFGAWLDTVVDELSSVGYMAAIGWHCHLRYGEPGAIDRWQVAMVVAVVAYAWSIYCVYYNIIVAVGSANSQDYIARFELAPGRSAGAVRLVAVTQRPLSTRRKLPRWLEWLVTCAPYVVRRDFIVWFTAVLVAAQQTRVCFLGLAFGGVATSLVLSVDHLRLRALRRAVTRRGQIIESPHAAPVQR